MVPSLDTSLDVSKETDDMHQHQRDSSEWASVQETNLIYREIAKTFQYMLFHYDVLQKLMIENEAEY